jgi:hypothetical protein
MLCDVCLGMLHLGRNEFLKVPRAQSVRAIYLGIDGHYYLREPDGDLHTDRFRSLIDDSERSSASNITKRYFAKVCITCG